MVGRLDDLLPDRGPSAARQALAAADELRVFDGGATAWLVAQRGLEVRGVAMLLAGVFYGGVLVGQWMRVVAGVAVVAFARGGPGGAPCRCRAPAGARPVAGVFVLAVATAILLAAIVPLAPWVRRTRGSRPGRCLSPSATSSCRSCGGRRPVVGRAEGLPGPDGAHAFAVLSVLARAQWVHPDRLSALTGLPHDRCDAWVQACSARALAAPAARGRLFLRNPSITAAGLSGSSSGPASSRGEQPALSRGPTRPPRPAPT